MGLATHFPAVADSQQMKHSLGNIEVIDNPIIAHPHSETFHSG